MNLVISDDSRPGPGPALREALKALDRQTQYLSADQLDIRPCTACGSCSGRTYGRCVLPDDMQQLLPLIARCKRLVLVGPVVFGGPGFHLKKVIDRMAAVGDPRYYLRQGELVKGMAGEGFNYYLVGAGEGLNVAEREAFSYLQRENSHIMGSEGRAFQLGTQPSDAEINQVAEVIIHG